MTTAPAPPAWRVVEAPRPHSLDAPDAWAHHGVAALERAVALADLGHDDVAPRAVENGTDGLPPWTVDALDEAGAEHPTVLPDTGEDLAFEEIAADINVTQSKQIDQMRAMLARLG